MPLNYGADCQSGPGCLKLTTSLVNVSLKFQMLIAILCNHQPKLARIVMDFDETFWVFVLSHKTK